MLAGVGIAVCVGAVVAVWVAGALYNALDRLRNPAHAPRERIRSQSGSTALIVVAVVCAGLAVTGRGHFDGLAVGALWVRGPARRPSLLPSTPRPARPAHPLPLRSRDHPVLPPLLSDAGLPIEQISRLVGHAGTATTEPVYRKQIRPVVVHGADGFRGDAGGQRSFMCLAWVM
jgi:hypothetical protein